MDDGEIDHSGNPLLTNPCISSCGNLHDLRNAKKCTHTHTCNLPGPTIPTHTHTCNYTHTQVLSAGEDDPGGENEFKNPSNKLSGNREAVKKYREKRKAHEAYLEEEIKKLRHVNQQLLSRLGGQAALEAEFLSLKNLLVNLRAQIDTELGVYSFKKTCSSNALRRGDGDLECLMGDVEGAGKEGSCFPAAEDFQINQIADFVSKFGEC